MTVLEMLFFVTTASESVIVTVFIILTLCLLLLKLISPKRPANLPPGPYPWPIVGNLWELSKDPRDNWPKLREKYGDIVSVQMGSRLVVILNSYDVMKEALVSRGDVFSDRPDFFLLKALSNCNGIVTSSGNLWKEQRTFMLFALRQFGLDKRSFENKVSDEIQELIDVVDGHKGKPFDIRYLMTAFTLNVIFSVVFDKRFHHDDKEFKNLIDCVEAVLHSVASTGVVNILPWVRHIPGDLFKYKLCLEKHAELEQFLSLEIMKIKSAWNESDKPQNYEPQNFVELYLQKIEDEKKKNPDVTNFSDTQLLRVIVDLFFAGSDTTAASLRWILLYAVKYPDMQGKIQKEIDDATGGTRSPCLRDRPEMPFTEAFISEVQRCSVIVPISMFHATSADSHLRGYFIPKGTVVFQNLHGVLHDRAFWGDPEVFRPSRFLNDERRVTSSEQFVPFSLGRRRCLGESIANMQLFLFATRLLQLFNIRLPEGAVLPDMTGRFGITVPPPEFEICAEKRSNINSI